MPSRLSRFAGPVVLPDTDREIIWREAESAGSAGLPCPSDDPTAVLGYNRGVCARENRENGYAPGIDGGQW